jgi:nitronate monooxygenase/enoyl-[acyl-carrier protein] reductase II
MLRTRFCEIFGIEHPILQAPIWPGASPELAAAVCKAGGLGSIAGVFGSAERVKDHITRVRALTNRPFAVNHVVPFLNEEAFDVTLKARPAVITLSLGDPGDLVKRAHDAGALVIHQVHTVKQAYEAAERGVDAIIAQGSEAGGQGMALGVGTMALIPQVVDAVKPIPVLGAGGIGDGRGLAAALILGAQGINIGTRFVASEEASAEPPWKQAVLNSQSEDAVRFEEWQEIFPREKAAAYPATPRVLRSPFVEKWKGRPDAVRQAAPGLKEEILEVVREHRLDKILPFGGQTAGMIHEIVPAAKIVHDFVADAERILSGAGAIIK